VHEGVRVSFERVPGMLGRFGIRVEDHAIGSCAWGALLRILRSDFG
jgi:hypothetical protein